MITALRNWLASRARRARVTTVVLHATGGESASGAIEWLRKIGLSYHYVVARDGTVTKCVPTSREAFHAGVSEGPHGAGVNRYSIGIAMTNRNDGEQAYPEAQVAAVDALIAEIVAAMPGVTYVTTHRAIAPRRKTDPAGFDVSRVANGLRIF